MADFGKKFEIKGQKTAEIYDVSDNILSGYDDASKDAVKKAMHFLQDADKTEWQVRDSLAKKGFEDEAIENALKYVRAFHYVDDSRYARIYVNTYLDRRSLMRIKQDLMKKHIDENIIEQAIEESGADDSGALYKDMKKILEKYDLENLTPKDRQAVMAKAYRKGYNADMIRKCLDSFLEDPGLS
ncbi:MAG: regulatory protein RecX [Lachnospiraceae bacterium]|jgi:regulatory protein|nr:regulatory protein RecX [Lachnospiraceae bacterium]MEE3461535.1 regulatory protein RecX [Lachnospiraceae bacterium]